MIKITVMEQIKNRVQHIHNLGDSTPQQRFELRRRAYLFVPIIYKFAGDALPEIKRIVSTYKTRDNFLLDIADMVQQSNGEENLSPSVRNTLRLGLEYILEGNRSLESMLSDSRLEKAIIHAETQAQQDLINSEI